MSNDDQWITTLIAEAQKHHSLVTEAVSIRMGELLKGPLRERQVPATELAKVAKALIVDMVPAPPKAEAKQ